jgi:glycogen operon protein
MDSPPRHPASDTVIYETHVRGFTIHSSSGAAHPGTFDGLTRKDTLSPRPGRDRH